MNILANDLANSMYEKNCTLVTGGAMHLGRSMSLDNSVKGATDVYNSSMMEKDGSYGLQNSMGWPRL
jgi:hypothetical protein